MASRYFVILIFFLVIGDRTIWAKSQFNATSVKPQRSSNQTQIRETRFARPFHGFIGIWNTLGNIKRLFNNQYNETTNALQRILNLLSDGFTDTATKKPYQIVKPIPGGDNETLSQGGNETSATGSTTTERYRISRRELGYILGRNYRGLQKLFRIELNDALNQSQYSIKEYHRDIGNSLAQYTIPKELPPEKPPKS